jgi:outer membrane protein insertion porin family
MERRLLPPFALFLCALLPTPLFAQTATLREIHVEGLKVLTEPQVAALAGLSPGMAVGRKELQDAADELVRTGLFAKVTYNFNTHNDNVVLTFRVEENPRLPVLYDNIPWYSDSELNDAIRKDLPFYNATLPEAGAVVELVAQSLKKFLSARDPNAQVIHEVLASPLADGNIQEFHVAGLEPKIASVEFSDPALAQNRAVQAHLPEIRGKNYSRLTIDIFLAEQIRPIYQQDGYLRAKIGPSEVRLTGDPSQKFPEQIPVYVPCQPGPVYKWKDIQWSGNSFLSTITLTNLLGLKPGDVANGMMIEGAWDRIREEYGQHGYLDAKILPTPFYDDTAHSISYTVSITEGPQFHYDAMTITGMSLAGERLINEAWPMKPGDVFDKKVFEQVLTQLQTHRQTIFKDLPVHYDAVGHWLQTDSAKATVDVLLDFK